MRSNLLTSKVLEVVCRYFLAALFIFSGIAKGINPFGLSNQFGEYFNALGLGFLSGTELAWAILLPAFEVALGLFLIFGVFRWLVSWAVLLMMVGFTGLTLWIAISNPVSDCGCFGEILKISNRATFWKNIVFTAMAFVLFKFRDEESVKLGNYYTVTLAMTSFLVPFYFLWNVPPIESTVFKTGVNLEQAMISSEDMVSLPILDANMNNLVGDFVNDSTKVVLIVSPKLKDINYQAISALRDNLKNTNIELILLTAVPLEEIPKQLTDLAVKIYNSDYTILKTVIQNFQGGAVLIKNGVIEQKWSMSGMPNNL